MSTATRAAALQQAWSATQGSLACGGITGVAEISNVVAGVTASNIGSHGSGTFLHSAMDALRRLFVAYDARLNAVDSWRVPWAADGAAKLTLAVAALDGEV